MSSPFVVMSGKSAELPIETLRVDYADEDQLTKYLTEEYGLDLESALRYQRNRKTVENAILKRGFKPALFDPLTVNERKDNIVVVVDGATRLRALRRWLDGERGPDRKRARKIPHEGVLVPCVVNHWSRKEEQEAFVEKNEQRLGLSSVDKFVAYVSMGDPDHVRIQKMLETMTGATVGGEKGWGCPGELYRTVGIPNPGRPGFATKVIEGKRPFGFDLLEDALTVLVETGWVKQPSGKTQGILGGIVECLRFGAKPSLLVRTIDEMPRDGRKPIENPKAALAAGKARAGLLPGSLTGSRDARKGVASVLEEYHNKGRRSNRIEIKYTAS